jgi:hypothetical protein
MSGVSIPRLHSVQMKSGGAKLAVLRNRSSELTEKSFAEASAFVSEQRKDDMSGYAIVSWGRELGVSVRLEIRESRNVGAIGVPEFVKLALIDHIAIS